MNRFRVLFAAVFLGSVAGAVSCASQKAASETGQQRQAEEDSSPVVTPAEVPWKDMTKHQRARYMGKVVTPKMREVFQAFDAKHFAKVNCATCHGKNAKEKEFKMPNPELPKLPASEKVFMETVMKKKPEMVKFMAEQVTPKMAELLGLKPFDPKAPDPAAFSCEGCHTLEGAPDQEPTPAGG